MSRFSPWPAGIALWLMFVVAVNLAFVYVATQSAPEVDPSYNTVDR